MLASEIHMKRARSWGFRGLAAITAVLMLFAAGCGSPVILSNGVSGAFALNPTVATVLKQHTLTFTAVNGTAPYSYSIYFGGGAIDSSSGIFTAGSAAETVVIQATDANLNVAYATTNVVDSPIVLPPTVTLAVNDKFPFSVNNAKAPVTFSVESGGGSVDSVTGVFTAGSQSGSSALKITDANGLTATAAITVNSQFVVSPSSTTVKVNGAVTLSASGGVPPYHYFLFSGNGAVNATTGAYSAPAITGIDVVKAVDAFGNISLAGITIQNSLVLSPNSSLVAAGSTIAFAASHGVPPYSYTVTSGSGTIGASSGLYTAPNSVGGPYTISVTDGSGGVATATVSVTSALTFSVSSITLPVNGTFDFAPVTTGGVGAKTYIVPSAQGSFAGPLYTAPSTPGVYVVQVKDSQSPSPNYASAQVTVNPALSFSPSTATLAVLGEQSFSPAGGVLPYTFSVQTGGGTVSSAGLYTAPGSAGSAVVKVTDSYGETATASITINPGLGIVPLSKNLAVSSSFGFSASGGVSPYSYSVVSGGGTVVPASGVYTASASPGTATVRVTDFLGNTSDSAVTVVAPLILSPSVLALKVSSPAVPLAATGGLSPYSYSIVSGGGSVDSSGNFTAPATPGVTVVQVTDQLGSTKTSSITVYNSLVISPLSRTLVVSQTFSFSALGGTSPYTYSVLNGGGTINASTGAYTAPSTAGSATIQVTDSSSNTSQATVTINPVLGISPASSILMVGDNSSFSATGGVAPFVFSLTSGGGTLSSSTGSYTAPGTAGSATILVTDANATSATASVTINAALAGTSSANSNLILGTGGSTTFSGSGGVPPYAYSIVSGGGTINSSTGVYTAGSSGGPVVIRVTDAYGNFVNYTLNVYPSPVISPSSVILGVNDSNTFTTTTGSPPYTYSVASGGGTVGASSGVYTAPASSGSAVVLVTDSLGISASASVTINGALQISPTTATLAAGGVQSFSSTGGVGAVTYSLVSGLGTLSGGTYTGPLVGGTTATISATDSIGNTSDATITVNDAAPTSLSYATSPATYVRGSAIVANTPSNLGGIPTSYSITPALPSGLSLSTSTGVISGNPSVFSSSTDYSITAANGIGSTSVVLNITVTTGSGSRLVFTTQPGNGSGGSLLATQPVVSVEDSGGNVITTATANITLAIATNPGSGSLSGTIPVAAVSGVATFTDLAIDKVGTGYTLIATGNGLLASTSSTFNIAAGSAAKLAFATQPGSGLGGQALGVQPVVAVQDAGGNTLTSSGASIALAIISNPGSGTLSGTATVSASSGVASFSGLSIDKIGSGYTLAASSSGLTSVTSSSFNVTLGSAAKLAFLTQPGGGSGGSPWSTQPVVAFEDAGGNTVSSTTQVSLAIVTNAGVNGVLSGTTTLAASAGLATFSGLSIDKSGSGYTLSASSVGLPTVTSSGFNIAVGSATKLAFTTSPGNGTGGTSLGTQPVVSVQDAGGNTVTSSTASISLAIGTNPGSGALSGTASVAASSGVVTFAGLSIDKVGSGYTFVATSSGLTNATSSTFNVGIGTATQLAFNTQPGNGTGGSALSTQPIIFVQDAGGNTVTTSTASIALAIGNNPSSGTLAGTSTVNSGAGVATFSGLSIDKAGTGYTLVASGTSLTSATSSALNITVGSATKLAFTGQPSNGAGGVALTGQPVISVEDAGGNIVTSSSSTINLVIGTNPSTGTLSGTASLAATSGVATYSGLSIDRNGTGYTLVATGSGLTNATSSTFSIGGGLPVQLAFSTQPGNGTGGSALSTQPVVVVQDAGANTVTSSTASIVIAIGTNPGSGTLSGTATLTVSSGVATFSGLSIDKIGTGYTFTVSSSGLTSATSNAFNVTTGSATKLTFNQQPGSSTGGVALGTQPSVTVQDAGGNTVTTSSSSISLTIGTNPSSGALSGTNTLAASSGVDAFSGLSINSAGTGYTLVAASSGLTSATSSAFNIAVGTPSQLSFTTQPGNGSGGSALGTQPVVKVLDAGGNIVTSSSASIALAIASNPNSGTLGGGLTTVTAASGVAAFSALSIDKAGSGYTLAASSSGVTSSTSSAFNIAVGSATQLAFSTQPGNGTGGSAFSTQPVVSLLDSGGNTVPSASSTVTLTLGSNPGAGTLAGTLTLASASGVATFSGLSINKIGTAYTLVTSNTSSLANATSSTFNVTLGALNNFVLASVPASVTQGVASSLSVTARDAGGNTKTDFGSAVTLSSTDTSATLPSCTLTSGVNAACAFTLNTLGSKTVTVTSGSVSQTTSAITVNAVAPSSLVYSTSPAIYTKNSAITADSPSNSGGTIVSYSISPVLPSGLSLSSTTGIISGTPTVIASTATYSITGTDTGGSTAVALTLTVNDVAPSSLTYGTNPATYTKNSAITPDSPSNSGGAVVSYSIAPALPSGLSLNTSTGVVSGTPSLVSAVTAYTVTATNTGGSATINLTLTVNDIAPSSLAYSSNPATYTKNAAITSNSPSNSGGTVVSYSVTPSLPSGISLNTSSGIISGTPSAIASTAAYTITGTNTGGSTTLALTITVNDAAPTSLAYATNPATYTKGTSITPDSPSNSGGSVVSYSVSPSLPSGLSLNTGTGVVSGTPSAITSSGAYTVTATNTGGSTTLALTITVNDAAPTSLTYATNPASYTKNSAISANSPSNSGGAIVSYSVSPALPSGLSLSSSSGIVTGTPSSVTAQAVYSVTGTNTGGSTTIGLTLTVNDIAPVISYATNPAYYLQNSAITPNTPSSSGGAVVSYSITPVLPSGLTLSTSTGVISGTPTVSSTNTNYSITGTNSGGSSSVVLNIGVGGAAAKLAFGASPGGQSFVSQTAFSPAVTVSVQDSNSTTVTNATNSVTLTLGSNTVGGTLSGTLTQSAVNGVATFSNVKLNLAATNYTLVANASGLTASTSSAFTVVAGAASQVAFSSGSSSASLSTCTGPYILSVQDSSGNTSTNASGSSWNILLSVTGSATLWSNSSCTVSATSTSVAPSASSSSGFYLSDPSIETVTLTANGSGAGLGTHSLSVSLTASGLIALGEIHTCTIVNGGVLCWGYNADGELGNATTYGSTNPNVTPAQVLGLTSGVTSIAAGYADTCALVNGSAWCWGYNTFGELGNASNLGGDSATPLQVSGLTSGVSAVAVGNTSSCAVVNGSARCWGLNSYGELGNSTALGSHTYTPLQVGGLTTGVSAIAGGSQYACALTNGGVQCWGWNQYGQLGNSTNSGTATPNSSPLQVLGLTTGVTALAAGTAHTCALLSGGSVQCWGENNYGQLGNSLNSGSTAANYSPVQVSGLTSGVTAISAGFGHSCALLNGSLKCWGWNDYGQLGNTTNSGTNTANPSPLQVSGLTSGVTALGSGNQALHNCAIVSGRMQCWGYNNYGELGNSTNIGSGSPVATPGLVQGLPGGPATQLAINGASTINPSICSGPFSITVLDVYGNNSQATGTSAWTFPLSVTGSAGIYGPSDSTCASSNVTQTQIAVGSSTSGNFYLKDAALETFTLSVNGSSYTLGTASSAIQTKNTFVFVVPNQQGPIYLHSQSPTTGLLSAGVLQTSISTADAYNPTLSPNRNFLYVPSYGTGGGILQYSINSSSGALTALSPPVASGGQIGAYYTTFTPDGKFAYTLDLNFTGSIFQYTASATTGLLTPLSPFTISAGSGSYDGYAATPIVVEPSGRFLYASKRGDNAIFQFTITASGQLSPLSPSSVAPSATQPESIAVHPNGKFVYVAADNTSNGGINQYTMNSDGTLSPLSPAALTLPHTTNVIISPNGNYLYAGQNTSATALIYQYSINTTTGTLSPLSPASACPGTTGSITLSGDGRYFYGINFFTNYVIQCSVNSDGTLTPLSPASIVSTTGAFGIVAW